MKNREIAALFNEIADILELRGENRFRINAYRRAGQSVDGLSKSIEDIAAEGKLNEIPGIGKDLEAKIGEYIDTGRIGMLDSLKEDTPAVLIEMLRVPGVGPKTAVLLYEELGIESLEELKLAAKEHRIQGLPKIKAKTEENILKGIEFLESSRGRTPIGEAYPLAEGIVESLEKLPEVKRISLAGSMRRWNETVGDIDILVTSPSPESVIHHLTHLEIVDRILAEGKTKGSIVASKGIQVDLRVVEEKSYGAALNYFTGSKEHNIRLREIAIQREMKLNEYGVFKKLPTGTERRIAGSTEENVYSALGLPFIPPEIREDTGEMEAAKRGSLPDLVSNDKIKGDLHFHSDWSDGIASLEEIALAGKKTGYKYIAVTDHSKSLHIAHGLSEKRLLDQMAEIDRINGRIKGFRLLKGIEVDILPDGSLDLDEGVLKMLDVVIAAVHTNFKMNRTEMTGRVVTALENPYTNILAHPTGRLIGTRPAYDIDMDAVIKAAAANFKSIEINAHPMRLDLDSRMSRKAAEAGVSVSIGTDTHNPSVEMRYMIYGVGIARRGWLTPGDILNTRNTSQFLSAIRKKSGKT